MEQVLSARCFRTTDEFKEPAMLTREERALATNIGDRLLELYAERDEAIIAGDLVRVHDLQAEVEEASEQRQKILRRRRTLAPV
jgi:hypothetical protein